MDITLQTWAIIIGIPLTTMLTFSIFLKFIMPYITKTNDLVDKVFLNDRVRFILDHVTGKNDCSITHKDIDLKFDTNDKEHININHTLDTMQKDYIVSENKRQTFIYRYSILTFIANIIGIFLYFAIKKDK